MAVDEKTISAFVRVAEKKFLLSKFNKGAFMHFYPV